MQDKPKVLKKCSIFSMLAYKSLEIFLYINKEIGQHMWWQVEQKQRAAESQHSQRKSYTYLKYIN